MKKTYVLDTNVLLSDPDCLNAFEDNDLLLPLAVIEELDRQKSRQDEVGKNARSINRTLDSLRDKGSLFNGVKLVTGGTLMIRHVPREVVDMLPAELMSETQVKVDNLIIAFMMHLKNQKSDAVLVSKDINVRLKCDALGMKCQDYLRLRVTKNQQEFYRGVRVVEVEKSIIDKVYADGYIDKLAVPLSFGVEPNEIVILKCVDGVDGAKTVASAMTRSLNEKSILKKIENFDKIFTLTPKNKEQKFSLDLLMDQNVKLVTLVGPSGTGKTLLALAAGLEQLKGLGKNGVYDKMIVTRSVQPVGRDIGFLPGSMQEKMDPWLAPVKDNLDFLLSTSKQMNGRSRRRSNNGNEELFSNEPYLSIMQERGLIEVEAITYIRGRSIPRAFIVIDEVQNLSMHEIKTIITRAGEGTKIVLTGDIEQIDNVHVDVFTNGLTYVVEKFKDQVIAGHVTLIKGERSELATIASKIL